MLQCTLHLPSWDFEDAVVTIMSFLLPGRNVSGNDLDGRRVAASQFGPQCRHEEHSIAAVAANVPLRGQSMRRAQKILNQRHVHQRGNALLLVDQVAAVRLLQCGLAQVEVLEDVLVDHSKSVR